MTQLWGEKLGFAAFDRHAITVSKEAKCMNEGRTRQKGLGSRKAARRLRHTAPLSATKNKKITKRTHFKFGASGANQQRTTTVHHFCKKANPFWRIVAPFCHCG